MGTIQSRPYGSLGVLALSVLSVLMLSCADAQEKEKKEKESRPIDEIGKCFYVWKDDGVPGKFVPSGFMPDGEGISQGTAETDTPHSRPHCIRLHAQLSEKPWVGIYFLLEGEWEPKGKPFNLFEQLGAKKGDPIKCRFWARSKKGATVQFKVGGVTKGKIADSLTFPVATPWITLTPEWKRYEIDLTGKDLSSLVGGFVWVCDRMHNDEGDVTFDLDDIYFVKTKPESKESNKVLPATKSASEEGEKGEPK